jgi:hypothetical protein
VTAVLDEPADHAIFIAPETDGVLLQLARALPEAIGSSLEAIELTSDKLALAGYWREHGIPTPATTDREPTPCEAFPVVWKPRDGCGSTATFLLENALDAARATAQVKSEHAGAMILQEFVPGRAASLAFLCGPRGYFPLIPAFQAISTDGRFHYLGGELPIPSDLAARAIKIGSSAIAIVPGLKGFIGIDLVLGDSADGSLDFAIEINPRLTTSYVGLRGLAEFNIAEAMLKIAAGEAPPKMCWKAERIRFTPDGRIGPVGQV